MISILLSIFLILWIIIGVGALWALFKTRSLINQAKQISQTLKGSVEDISSLTSAILDKKQIIIGSIGTLYFLKELFTKIKRKNKK